MKKIDNYFVYVNEFVESYRLDLKSEATIKNYLVGLNELRKYLSDIHGIKLKEMTFSTVTADLIRLYLKWIIDNGKSINTRNARLTAIKLYCRFCSMKRVDLANLTLEIDSIKTKFVAPKTENWMTKKQITCVINQPSRNKIGIRDRFIMLFMFSTGARLSELINIRVCDVCVDTETPYLVLTGKGKKTRLIPIASDFIKNFTYYLRLYHLDYDANQFLFYTIIRGIAGKMSEDNIQRIVIKYSKMARAIDKSIPVAHPHLFRHTFAALMYRNGLSLPELAKLLGHEQLSTTEIYAETDFDIISQSMSKLSKDSNEISWLKLDETEKLKLLGLLQ